MPISLMYLHTFLRFFCLLSQARIHETKLPVSSLFLISMTFCLLEQSRKNTRYFFLISKMKTLPLGSLVFKSERNYCRFIV